MGWSDERITPPEEPAPGARTEPAAVTSPPPKRAPAEPTAAVTPSPDTDALYRATHVTHFVEHDPGTAIGKWDAYLAAAPRGRFSTEARKKPRPVPGPARPLRRSHAGSRALRPRRVRRLSAE